MKKDPPPLLPPARLLELKALHLALAHHLQAAALLVVVEVVVVADLLLALDQLLRKARLFIPKDLLHVLQTTVHLLRLKDLTHALQATLHLLRLLVMTTTQAEVVAKTMASSRGDPVVVVMMTMTSSQGDVEVVVMMKVCVLGMSSGFIETIKDAIKSYRTSKEDDPVAAAEVANSSGSIACVTQAKAFQDCLDEYETDISKCQTLMDMWCKCKKSSKPTT
ncbi:hypothetical protein Bca4012_024476 [Brassica carinata]